MKIKTTFTLLFFIAFTTLSVKAQTNWFRQRLNEQIAVHFPSTPEILGTGNNIVYRYIDKDIIIYSANIIDFKAAAHLDSAKLALMKDTQQFADALKGGMSRTAKNYEFGDVSLSKWEGCTTYNIIGKNVEKKTKIYILIILIGSKGYSLSCIVPDIASSKRKNDFFSNVERSH